MVLVVVATITALLWHDMDSKAPDPHLDMPPPIQAGRYGRLVDFRDAARAADLVLALPDWPQSPQALQRSMQQAIAESEMRLASIAQVKSFLASFRNTVQAFETAHYPAADARGVAELLAQTHPSEDMRRAAREALDAHTAWLFDVASRQDIYQVIRLFVDTEPPLGNEDDRLLRAVMRDYRHTGMELDAEKRGQLITLRQQLSQVENEFLVNINQADLTVEFTAAELGGIPATLLEQVASISDDGHYSVEVNDSWQYEMLIRLAGNANTRRKLTAARFNRAAEGKFATGHQHAGSAQATGAAAGL